MKIEQEWRICITDDLQLLLASANLSVEALRKLAELRINDALSLPKINAALKINAVLRIKDVQRTNADRKINVVPMRIIILQKQLIIPQLLDYRQATYPLCNMDLPPLTHLTLQYMRTVQHLLK